MRHRAELTDRDVAGVMQLGSIKPPPRSLAGRIKCQFSALLKRYRIKMITNRKFQPKRKSELGDGSLRLDWGQR